MDLLDLSAVAQAVDGAARKPQSGPWLVNAGSIRLALDVAYRASLIPEEGRHPQFCLALPATDGAGSIVVPFSDAPDLTPGRLAKLSAGVPGLPYGVVAYEDAGKLRCKGIGVVHNWPKDFPLDPGRVAGLVIHVLGPGHLEVLCEGVHWVLHQARATSAGPRLGVVMAGSIRADVLQLAEKVAGRELTVDELPVMKDLAEGTLEYLVGECRRARCGGTFAFIPDEPGVEKAILGGQRAKVDLAMHIARRLDNEERSLSLQTHVRAVGQLGAIDGAVVFKRPLRLFGYGCKLTYPDDPITLPPEVAARGMRHQSAYRFCTAYPGSAAIVVSQDGGITTITPGSPAPSIQAGVSLPPGRS